MVRSWLVGPKREPDEVDASLRARVHAMQKRAYELQADVDASLRRSETLRLDEIEAPTLVVRGALDWPDVEVAADRFLTEIRSSRGVVFDDCAHLPTMEQPERFVATVRAFLGESAKRD